jgi:hypothetical protein
MVPTAIVNIVVKKALGNQTWVGRAVSKYVSHCAMAKAITRTNQDLWSNKEEHVK